VLALGAAALGALAGGCGKEHATRSGLASTDTPVVASISLNDSSVPSVNRTTSSGSDGTFSLSMAGLNPPFLLRVEWTDSGGARRLYGVAEGHDNLDVNALTDLAFCGGSTSASDDAMVFEHSDAEGKHQAGMRARALLAKLSIELAPLFARYGITDPRTDRDAVRELLRDVQVTRRDGVVTVTNRATGGVIFVGPISDLASGVFTAANMPPGPGATTCTAFTYSAFGACQVDGTQTRTILTSSPDGCSGGAPVTTQTCVFVPPVNTCTSFTYSAYGACQADNTQTRTVLTSAPAGCTGGAPVTTQACVFVPPIDGAALYTQLCAGCHGNTKKHKSVAAIQGAINANTGNMGVLSGLTPAQVAAISAAP
jgi:hypothetical protein